MSTLRIFVFGSRITLNPRACSPYSTTSSAFLSRKSSSVLVSSSNFLQYKIVEAFESCDLIAREASSIPENNDANIDDVTNIQHLCLPMDNSLPGLSSNGRAICRVYTTICSRHHRMIIEVMRGYIYHPISYILY